MPTERFLRAEAVPRKASGGLAPPPFPLALRIGAALWLAVWIPAYWLTYGAANFLHFCDIAVLLTSLACIASSPLLLASQAVASLMVDLTWIADMCWKLTLHRTLLGGIEYMFDPQYPLWVRLLSLFHIAMPVLLWCSVRRFGYDHRALLLECAVALPALAASRLLTPPALNINYAFADPFFHRQWGPAPTHLLLIFSFMLVVVYGPTHLLLRSIMPDRRTMLDWRETPPNS